MPRPDDYRANEVHTVLVLALGAVAMGLVHLRERPRRTGLGLGGFLFAAVTEHFATELIKLMPRFLP